MRSLVILALLGSSAFAATQQNPLKCKIDAAVTPEKSDPRARQAAQRGLDFLAQSSTQWSKSHQDCFGCHVHSVTLEGLVIGRRNQYKVANADLALMVDRIIKPRRGSTAPASSPRARSAAWRSRATIVGSTASSRTICCRSRAS